MGPVFMINFIFIRISNSFVDQMVTLNIFNSSRLDISSTHNTNMYSSHTNIHVRLLYLSEAVELQLLHIVLPEQHPRPRLGLGAHQLRATVAQLGVEGRGLLRLALPLVQHHRHGLQRGQGELQRHPDSGKIFYWPEKYLLWCQPQSSPVSQQLRVSV